MRLWLDPRIDLRVHCADHPVSPGTARNRLAQLAKGQVVSFVDADDELFADRLRLVVRDQFWDARIFCSHIFGHSMGVVVQSKL